MVDCRPLTCRLDSPPEDQDQGAPAARLLAQFCRARSDDAEISYARRLLVACRQQNAVARPDVKPPPQLIETLTERELDVLQLIAEGLTNPEIAKRLFVSLPTVKSHTRNLYGKLGVHSRKQAVAQARALGLLAEENAQVSKS